MPLGKPQGTEASWTFYSYSERWLIVNDCEGEIFKVPAVSEHLAAWWHEDDAAFKIDDQLFFNVDRIILFSLGAEMMSPT